MLKQAVVTIYEAGTVPAFAWKERAPPPPHKYGLSKGRDVKQPETPNYETAKSSVSTNVG
jgi:hypothetical protein